MRFVRFGRFLTELAPQAVFFEEVQGHPLGHSRGNRGNAGLVKRPVATLAIQLYGGFVATVMAWCERRGVPYAGVPVATVKKRATGRGNAKKVEVVAAAMAAYGLPATAPDDQADALWVLQVGLDLLSFGPR